MMIEKPAKRKPYEADDNVVMESVLAEGAGARRRACIHATTDDDPARAAYVDEVWSRLEGKEKDN